MPSTTDNSVSIDLDSSMVITPSLPTRSIASAIKSPMAGSPEETAATWAMASLDKTG